MDTKIQSLTDKLYNEGVEKGKAEAEVIIENAKKEKEVLLKHAKIEAGSIIDEATKKAGELKKNTESELKLYTSQAVEALKSEIADLITGKIAEKAIGTAFNEKNFMSEMILKLVSEWSKTENLVVSTSDAENLQKYFETKAKNLLDKGLKIEQVNGKATSFSIFPDNNSYKVNFGEQEFIDYFKTFLRPKLIELLF